MPASSTPIFSDADQTLFRQGDLSPFRAQFEDFGKNVYLNTPGRSALPKTAYEAAVKAIGQKFRPYEVEDDDEMPLRQQVSATLLPGSRPTDIALHVCCSGHMSTVAENLREIWQREDREEVVGGREILILEDTMTSNVYPWQSLVDAGLAKFCVVREPRLMETLTGNGAPSVDHGADEQDDSSSSPAPTTRTWTDAILSVLKERSDKIRLVALMQNRWTDGSWIDLERLLPEIRALGGKTFVVLDLTQSMGVVPVSPTITKHADFIVASTHKWLLGLYGLAVMYVNPINNFRPIDHHERNRKGCYDGACLPFLELSKDTPAGGAQIEERPLYEAQMKPGSGVRLDVGGRPGNPVLLPTLLSGLRLIAEVGVPVIQKHCQELQDHFRTFMLSSFDLHGTQTKDVPKISSDFEMTRRSVCAPHMFGFKVRREGADVTEKCYGYLKGRKIDVSLRSGKVRVGVYAYNTKSDMEVLADAIRDFLMGSGEIF